MSNMHRIHWFDQRIREGHYPSSKDMALQFEISRRQAQRDIEYMAVSLRAPLLYIAKHRGYSYEDKTYVLPHLYITEEEKDVLSFLARKYGQYSSDQPSRVQRVAHLLSRFTGEEPPESFGQLPFFEAQPRLIEINGQLAFAISHRAIVHIRYRDEAGESRLDICPVQLVSKYNADYVAAYGTDGSRKRLYRVDGIMDLQVTSRLFEDRDEQDAAVVERDLPAIKPFTARIKLIHELEEATWFGYAARPVGELLYEIDFYDTESFMQQLMQAAWQRLDAPKWLRARLQARCEQVLSRLNGEEML
ncbi:helix-turn-helix transcriptional regulator [Paenibacillus chibensis]|uniref:helix-turn-helix transcriptional regulator n=1 Tax=Paenibacillus chibensis TaxID=59846 RepID=UPI000FDA18F3|nr:WYL domain-containing protein [Paenibacillus chibensis]MEC0368546.1 WYL domain-containing protein [Paenibacillus chibensis]